MRKTIVWIQNVAECESLLVAYHMQHAFQSMCQTTFAENINNRLPIIPMLQIDEFQ